MRPRISRPDTHTFSTETEDFNTLYPQKSTGGINSFIWYRRDSTINSLIIHDHEPISLSVLLVVNQEDLDFRSDFCTLLIHFLYILYPSLNNRPVTITFGTFRYFRGLTSYHNLDGSSPPRSLLRLQPFCSFLPFFRSLFGSAS